jgi:hypothetical protein
MSALGHSCPIDTITTAADLHTTADIKESIKVCRPCFRPTARYVREMKLSQVEDQAIQARMALVVGAKTFDRLFAGIRFDETDGSMLYAYAKNEDVASEIEDEFSLPIATVASKIIGREIEVVVVMPKVLQ